MLTDFSWHAIAVGNRVLGLYNFLVLSAPPSWRIVIMPMASDVFRHREINGVKWVRDGEVMHFVRDGGKAYVLKIKAKPGRRVGEGEAIFIGGHQGVYRVSRGRGGLKLAVEFYCDVTDRTITVELEGLENLDILNYIGRSQCH